MKTKTAQAMMIFGMTALAAQLAIGAVAYSAPTDALPSVLPPVGIEEGTETSLSDGQMSDLIPWANQSKESLLDLLDMVRTLGYRDAKSTLVRGIQGVLVDAPSRQTELLMRFVLNRALKINDLIEREADVRVPGTVNHQVRLLKFSVEMAIRYYENDLAYLSKVPEDKQDLVSPPFAKFGVEYSRFLMKLNNTLMDASAQYKISVMALGLLQWDLYRDSNKYLYALDIKRINSFLKLMPKEGTPIADRDAIKSIRQMKKVFQTVQSHLEEIAPTIMPM